MSERTNTSGSLRLRVSRIALSKWNTQSPHKDLPISLQDGKAQFALSDVINRRRSRAGLSGRGGQFEDSQCVYFPEAAIVKQ